MTRPGAGVADAGRRDEFPLVPIALQYDRNAGDEPWYFDDRGSDPNLYVPHPFKPETHELDPRPEKIAELVHIVNHDSDAIFRRTIEPFLDLEQFIKHIYVTGFWTRWSSAPAR